MKVTPATRAAKNTHGKYAQALMCHAKAIINEELVKLEINPNQLAKGMKLNPGTTHRFLNGELNSSMMVFIQVCTYLKLDIAELFRDARKRVEKDVEAWLIAAKREKITD